MLALLLFIFGILFSLVSLKFFGIPYILIAICWLLIFTILTLKSKKNLSKSIWFNLAFIVFLLGATEVYAYFSWKAKMKREGGVRYEGGYPKGYFTTDEVLGYAPTKDTSVRVKKYFRDQLLYDAVYTIGKDGLRVTPPAKSGNDDDCIVMFGGSFMFGEGENDNKSIPYMVGENQDKKVYNFGFHGYGPHQMLAAIENNMIKCTPKIVIYEAIAGHVARSAGYAVWDKHGPKYELKDGQLTYEGHFDDHDSLKTTNRLVLLAIQFKDRFIKVLRGSYIARRFFNDMHIVTDAEVELYIEIVDKSRQELEDKFPGVDFEVILWDSKKKDLIFNDVILLFRHNDESIVELIKEGFDKRNIKYHLVSKILPGYPEDGLKYEFSFFDPHPNALAQQLIAEYVLKNIVNKSDTANKAAN